MCRYPDDLIELLRLLKIMSLSQEARFESRRFTMIPIVMGIYDSKHCAACQRIEDAV